MSSGPDGRRPLPSLLLVAEWQERRADAPIIWPVSGGAGQYRRIEGEDGSVLWKAAKPSMGGGPPAEAWPHGETLTPEELLEALRGRSE
jgi:hypothetical protein